ncbi:hypothetical protein [Ruegeria sp. HKCCD7318]|uniref:hypothetical protein n=1 Tax=Ruegeria sp. HKCCD7318 TaxID=2683014 RepID=UPI00149176EE|nr:hypothetical protein [Ruegeria sp. HKCCD7318]NOE36325.1 hypothetical protein [Ruegeria sp. HKCCD7318]
MSKPSPPSVNRDALRNLDKSKLRKFETRFAKYEGLRREEELPVGFIAFEALASHVGAKLEGFTEDELRGMWPEEWGSSSVSFPLSLAVVLANAWLSYKNAPSGKTLGEAFGIEGSSKKPLKSKQKTRDRHVQMANEVEVTYLLAPIEDQPLSLEAVIEGVAHRHGVSCETVKKAHKKYGLDARRALQRLGILNGGKKPA